MAVISAYAQKKKLNYFFCNIPKNARILEVGCAEGWVGEYAIKKGYNNYIGLDLISRPNVDIVCDINKWKMAGMKKASFDYIIAFEVIEHGDFYKAFYDLLKPGGKLLVTTPVPHLDWACKILEVVGLNQKRTSEHSSLIYLNNVPYLTLDSVKVKGFMSQWGILSKPVAQLSLQ